MIDPGGWPTDSYIPWSENICYLINSNLHSQQESLIDLLKIPSFNYSYRNGTMFYLYPFSF